MEKVELKIEKMDMKDETRLEALIEEREAKTIELRSIEDQIEKEENRQFEHLVGKYLKLATTCCFRVDKIEYCDNSYVHIAGLMAYYSEGKLQIEIDGSESIYRGVESTEITKDEFLAFVNNGIDCIKNDILKK